MVNYAELLVKVNNFTCCSGAHELAVKAVIELHKPQSSTFDDDECAACSNAELSIIHPCATVQAIEKALA